MANAMDDVLAKVTESGRISLPAAHRKALGIETGGSVLVTLANGEIRIRPARRVMETLRADLAVFLRKADTSVDSLIDDRRAEAQREGKDDA
jgi:AbrB family looped-hinge helix DNA binding protein